MCWITQNKFIEGVRRKDGEKYSRQKRKKKLLFAEGFLKAFISESTPLEVNDKTLTDFGVKKTSSQTFWNFLPISISLSLLKSCFCDFMLNRTKEKSILLRLWEQRQKEWKNNNRARNKELKFLLLCSWSQWSNTCHIRRKPRMFVNNLCPLETYSLHYFMATALIIYWVQ